MKRTCWSGQMCSNFNNVTAAFIARLHGDVRHAAFPLLLRERLLGCGESLRDLLSPPSFVQLSSKGLLLSSVLPPPSSRPCALRLRQGRRVERHWAAFSRSEAPCSCSHIYRTSVFFLLSRLFCLIWITRRIRHTLKWTRRPRFVLRPV